MLPEQEILKMYRKACFKFWASAHSGIDDPSYHYGVIKTCLAILQRSYNHAEIMRIAEEIYKSKDW